MRLRMTVAAIAGGYALAVATSAPWTAGAADAPPAPCNGMHVDDPAADGAYFPIGLFGEVGESEPAPENLEVLGGFLNYAPATDGKKALTVNIVIKNLDKSIREDPGATGGNWYYAYWLYHDKVQFVRAANKDGTDIEFKYGSVSTGTPYGLADGNYTTEGDTTGTWAEGPGGVVSIVIPEAIGGKAGETLLGVGVAAETIQGANDAVGLNNRVDAAPDEYSVTDPPAKGKDYTVVDCPPATGPTDPSGTAATPAATPPTNTRPPSTQPGPRQPTAVPALPLKAPKSFGSARRAARKRSVTVKVTASEAISDLRISVAPVKGGGAVLTGRIAALKAGSTKIRLKASRKVRKGRHLLTARGTVDGQTRTVRQKVSLKK